MSSLSFSSIGMNTTDPNDALDLSAGPLAGVLVSCFFVGLFIMIITMWHGNKRFAQRKLTERMKEGEKEGEGEGEKSNNPPAPVESLASPSSSNAVHFHQAPAVELSPSNRVSLPAGGGNQMVISVVSPGQRSDEASPEPSIQQNPLHSGEFEESQIRRSINVDAAIQKGLAAHEEEFHHDIHYE